MKRKSMYVLVSVIMLLSMILAACAPAATPPPAAPTEAPQPTQAPAPTQPPAPTEAPALTEAPTVAATAEPKPLWTKELREAVAAAIDREAIVDRVFEGRNTPAYSMVPPSYPGATEPFLDKYGTRNLDMAKQLLTQAGYTADKPLTLDLWYPPDHYGSTTADVMQVVKEQLEETGLIKVTLQTQAWAQYIGESLTAGKFDFNILGWFPDFADPDTWLSPFASCEQSPGQGVFYCNPEMDKLLKDANSITDMTARNEIYKKIGVLYAEEVPTLPLFWEPEFISARKGVEGIAIGSTFYFSYQDLNFAADAKPASGSKDTIIIGTTDQLDNLDSADAYAVHDWEILNNTGQPLMFYTHGTAELIPGAAADLPKVSEDGKTYTFTLRPGIKYADGTPLKAADYVLLWNRLKTLKGQVSGLVTAVVDSVEAPDDVTVVYHLKAPTAYFLALTATGPFVVGNPNIFKEDALLPFPEKLDGIGPYRMTSYKANEQLVLEANPNYYGTDKPKIKTVIIKYFADPTTMSQAVEKGEIDIAWRILGAVEAVRLQTNVPDVVVTKIEGPALRYLVFNNRWPLPPQ